MLLRTVMRLSGLLLRMGYYEDMYKSKAVRVMSWNVNRPRPMEKQFLRKVLGVQVLITK